MQNEVRRWKQICGFIREYNTATTILRQWNSIHIVKWFYNKDTNLEFRYFHWRTQTYCVLANGVIIVLYCGSDCMLASCLPFFGSHSSMLQRVWDVTQILNKILNKILKWLKRASFFNSSDVGMVGYQSHEIT